MLGSKSLYAKECFEQGFVGVHYGIHEDLTGKFPAEWREFNKKYIPVYLKAHPDKSKIAAGLSCAAIWTMGYSIKKGDYVISPDGTGVYHLGEIDGDYYYADGGVLPHRRPVRWLNKTIKREDMSDVLKNSAGAAFSVTNLTKHFPEIESLLGDIPSSGIVVNNPDVEDPSAFAMEKHLEEFLVANWGSTELAKDFEIFTDEGEVIGQQYPTDTGPIDILAISKDRQRLLVIELKKGRASDVVVGQIARYMGFVQEELAENGQKVEGVIIALEDDKRIRWALSVFPNVKFYRYQVSFRLLENG